MGNLFAICIFSNSLCLQSGPSKLKSFSFTSLFLNCHLLCSGNGFVSLTHGYGFKDLVGLLIHCRISHTPLKKFDHPGK